MKKGFRLFAAMILLAFSVLVGSSTASAASKLILSASSIKLGTEEYASLSVKVNLTGKTPVYSSSDTSIVSVSQKGALYGKKKGSAVITVEAGKYKAACNVTVGSPKLIVEDTKFTLKIGERQKINVTKNTTGKKVSYKSSNPLVIVVSSKGNIRAVGEGSAYIRVKAGTRSTRVNVTVPAAALTLKESTLSIEQGKKGTVSISENTTGFTPIYSSSNSGIAKVNKNGTITGVKKGTATITVMAGLKKAKLKVTVTGPKVYPTKIDVDEEWMPDTYYDCPQKLMVDFYPENTTERKLTYESSNPEIAYITEDGIITPTGKALGTITITVRSENGLVTTTEHNIISNLGYIPDTTPKKEFDTTVLYNGKTMVDLGWTAEQVVARMGTPIRQEVNEYKGETYVYRPENASLIHVYVNEGIVKGYLLVGKNLSSAGFWLGEPREEINKLITWGRADSNFLGYPTEKYMARLFMDNVKDGSLYMLMVEADDYDNYITVPKVRNELLDDEYIEMMTNEFLDIVNAFRAANGREYLTRDIRMDKVAEAHAYDMAANDYYDHVNLQGEYPWDRLDKAGIYCGGYAVENIGWLGTSIIEEVHAYICSSGHRKNFLNARCTSAGIGFYLSPEREHSVFIAK